MKHEESPSLPPAAGPYAVKHQRYILYFKREYRFHCRDPIRAACGFTDGGWCLKSGCGRFLLRRVWGNLPGFSGPRLHRLWPELLQLLFGALLDTTWNWRVSALSPVCHTTGLHMNHTVYSIKEAFKDHKVSWKRIFVKFFFFFKFTMRGILKHEEWSLVYTDYSKLHGNLNIELEKPVPKHVTEN